jgi:hypothetical protein
MQKEEVLASMITALHNADHQLAYYKLTDDKAYLDGFADWINIVSIYFKELDNRNLCESNVIYNTTVYPTSSGNSSQG